MGIHFTDRHGGVSTGDFSSLNLGGHVGDSPDLVAKNRKLLSEQFGSTQYMNQVHGNRVAVIEEVTEEVPTADALITGIAGITLAVMIADCIPLILTSKHAVAAVHVGRKGLVNQVTAKTIEILREISDQPIAATIGPAICGKCYEVSQEIYDEVIQSHPSAAARTNSGTPALDLVAGLISDLQNLGITEINSQTRCTAENDDLFSYRRNAITGRQAGLVWL